MMRRLLKLSILLLFPDICLDDPDGRDIFLHADVQIIVALKYFCEHCRSFAHDEHQDHREKAKRR